MKSRKIFILHFTIVYLCWPDNDFSTSFLWPCAVCHFCFFVSSSLFSILRLLKPSQQICYLAAKCSTRRKCVNNKHGNSQLSVTLCMYIWWGGKFLLSLFHHEKSFAWLSYRKGNDELFGFLWHFYTTLVCIMSARSSPVTEFVCMLTHCWWCTYVSFQLSKVCAHTRRQLLYFVQVLQLPHSFFSSTRKIMLPSADNRNNIYSTWNVNTFKIRSICSLFLTARHT